MRSKLRVINIENAGACPFYIQNTHNQSQCVIKLSTTPQVITSLLENDVHANADSWDVDCQGDWENCSILPLLYRFNNTSKNDDKNSKAIEEYNPFDDSEDPDDYPDEPESPIITPEPEVTPRIVEMEQYPTKISIHQVENPYLVKGDVLVYPTNNQLYIDDLELRKMLRGLIDNELQQYLNQPIRMGSVYITTSGGDKSHVKTKFIYHAVVAGTSRLVNESDINDSTFYALSQASSTNAQSVVLIPSDCGTLDIYATAMVQLGAVKQFLKSHPETTMKNIFIVMTDELTYEVYNKYYKRIFKQRKAISQ